MTNLAIVTGKIFSSSKPFTWFRWITSWKLRVFKWPNLWCQSPSGWMASLRRPSFDDRNPVDRLFYKYKPFVFFATSFTLSFRSSTTAPFRLNVTLKPCSVILLTERRFMPRSGTNCVFSKRIVFFSPLTSVLRRIVRSPLINVDSLQDSILHSWCSCPYWNFVPRNKSVVPLSRHHLPISTVPVRLLTLALMRPQCFVLPVGCLSCLYNLQLYARWPNTCGICT